MSDQYSHENALTVMNTNVVTYEVSALRPFMHAFIMFYVYWVHKKCTQGFLLQVTGLKKKRN